MTRDPWTCTSRRLGWLAPLLLLALACAAVPSRTSEPEPTRRLEVLLTNDDGVKAPGLAALRKALTEAGHRVVVVAPAANRSGSGMSLTTRGLLVARELETGVWAVEGTPADCVRVALGALLEGPPDLVVSGINFGQNVGSGSLASGTVGAAMTARQLGLPALAISVAVDFRHPHETARFFPTAAAFTTHLVEALAHRAGKGPLLAPGLVLNVNHPTRSRAETAGVRLTRQGATSGFALGYTRRAEGFEVGFRPEDRAETVPDADTTLLEEGFVTITPLDGDWTASPRIWPTLEALVETLE